MPKFIANGYFLSGAKPGDEVELSAERAKQLGLKPKAEPKKEEPKKEETKKKSKKTEA